MHACFRQSPMQPWRLKVCHGYNCNSQIPDMLLGTPRPCLGVTNRHYVFKSQPTTSSCACGASITNAVLDQAANLRMQGRPQAAVARAVWHDCAISEALSLPFLALRAAACMQQSVLFCCGNHIPPVSGPWIIPVNAAIPHSTLHAAANLDLGG